MHVNAPYRGGPGLPVTRNMPFITASMPNRKQPRNMTGIYLGLEGNIKPPGGRTSVPPPLARGRGLSSRIRTPAEERRYLFQLDRERQKMVEVLRLKEEKKGFSGQPLRKKSSRPERSESPNRERLSSARKWGPAKRIDSRNVDELIKTNPRKYTHIANSGVTRSENLTGWAEFRTDGSMMYPLPNHVIQSATTSDDLSGLEECYKKVCKGSIETLHSLLPTSSSTTSHQHHRSTQQQRIRREQSAYTGTGFTVRSYRNPNQAEIVSDFPLAKTTGRPQTVPIRRPHVPQPYFFQFYNQSKLIGPNSAHFPKVTTLASDDGGHAVRIFASPGAGTLSRTLHLQSAASEPDHYLTHKVSDSPPPPSFCRTFHGAAADSQQLEISMPRSGTFPVSDDNKTNPSATIGQTEELDSRISQRSDTEDVKMDDGYMTGGGCESIAADADKYQDELLVGRTLKSSSSGADITVGLEKEDGTADEVEIDEVEAVGAELEPIETESPKGNVRKASIADKLVKTKQSEAIIATLKENAEQRQKDFQKLLNEHAEIVQEIGRTASSENLISQAEHGERDH